VLFTIRTLPVGVTFVCLSSAYRWGNTPLNDAYIGGNKNLIKLLEVARNSQLSELSDNSQESRGTNKIVVLTYIYIALPSSIILLAINFQFMDGILLHKNLFLKIIIGTSLNLKLLSFFGLQTIL
jgi:hypothetical protein